MKAAIRLSSSDVLESMELVAVVSIPSSVVWAVRIRLWIATQLILLASAIGGLQLEVDDSEEP